MKQDATPLTIYLTHRSALLDYATPIVGDRMRAEDIVQEAFIRFSTSTLEPERRDKIAQPVGYLYRIVRNLALDWVRHLSVEGEQDNDGTYDGLASSSPSPERAALYREELRHVAAALDELPERTRRAFEMHRLQGLTLQNVAKQLGISLGGAHQLVRDAITHCAEHLQHLDS